MVKVCNVTYDYVMPFSTSTLNKSGKRLIFWGCKYSVSAHIAACASGG
ncbi:Uncharacterised protein [Vibrio cholerae]|nr:Uncharacterised protein [Vibrio cholerae]